MTRVRMLLSAAVLAASLAWVPVTSIVACSCVSRGDPADVAGTSELAFVGTVIEARPGAQTVMGPTVAYAFDVERATVDVTARLEVHAVDDGGGASCGFVFGVGERWFVSAHTFEGTLSTGLCNGNALTDTMAADELDRVMELLPVFPVAEPAEATASDPSPLIPVVIGILGVVGIAAVTFVAFLRDPRGSA